MGLTARFNKAQISSEKWLVPNQVAYFYSSDGPQNCLGKKFSKVEVVVFSCAHLVGIVCMQDESDESARQRAPGCTEGVNLEILLNMTNADLMRLILSQFKLSNELGMSLSCACLVG
ncbi:hypothetical protein F4802DRAFT_87555 [Xylaria palmicola]|nr:hypothetical protein F4802DRAFT_87555 [Xylaria palmicola]